MEYQLPTLGMETLKRLTTIVVERQGRDFVYSKSGSACFYTPIPVSETVPETDNRTKSGCLIGEVLKEHGVPVEFLSGFSMCDSVKAVASALELEGILYINPTPLEVMFSMQFKQDIGCSWGKILDYLMTE